MRYFTAAELVETLYRGLADNGVGRLIGTLLRNDLIVVDLCRPRNYADRCLGRRPDLVASPLDHGRVVAATDDDDSIINPVHAL